MVSNAALNGNLEFHEDNVISNIDVAVFIRFLQQIKLEKLLSKVSDSRDQSKISYSNHSLLLWALSVFFSPGIKEFFTYNHRKHSTGKTSKPAFIHGNSWREFSSFKCCG